MFGRRYQIKRGDSLWSIAHENLGHGAQWPRIWRYNNRSDVIKATGHGIPDPDLIYAGRTILIPVLSHNAHKVGSKQPHPSRSAPEQARLPQHARIHSPHSIHAAPPKLKDHLPHVSSPIAIKFRLGERAIPPIETPTATIEVRLAGDIVLMTDKRYSMTYVTGDGRIETQVTRRANHALGQLINDVRFIYDPATKQVTVRSMLVSRSNTPSVPATAIGVEMVSNDPIPKLRAEIRFPKLEGHFGEFHYVATGLNIAVTIKPKVQQQRPPLPEPMPQPVPIRMPEPMRWGLVFNGVGLVVVGGLTIVGTVVDDFTLVGILDDPVSVAVAGAAIAGGLSMINSAMLPRAKVPATMRMGLSFESAGSL